MSQTHHLAAILFTDIVGYTAMMQKNEEQAISAIRSHNQIVQHCSTIHHGNVANFYGDGYLVIFDSANDAVECAINIQRELNNTCQVPVRIGLHLGEISYEEGKVIGDGVNVASRVQSLGVGNSILLSFAFYNNIKNHPEFKTISLGQFHFKNVDEPMEVFALTNEGLVVPKKGQMQGKLKEGKNLMTRRNVLWLLAPVLLVLLIIYLYRSDSLTTNANSDKSIAVLAFTDMSNNHDQGYLSDGIAEEIINSLCKFNALKVAGRTSSFSFKNKNEDLRTIGKKLNVAHILEGSVRKNEDMITITVRLTNAENGFTLLSESYFDELQNILDMQSKIALDVAEKIETKLSPKEKELLSTKKINPLAYETFLKGKVPFINGPLNGISEEMFRSKRYFEAAISLDSTYAEAHAYLALTYFNLADWALPRNTELEKSKVKIALDSAQLLAKKALTLDSLNSGGHLAMGSYYFHQYNWIEAEKEKRKAVKLNPGGVEEKFTLASFLGQFGQADEALRLDEESMRLDPLDPRAKLNYARDLWRARKFDECIRMCNLLLQEQPNSGGAYQFLYYSFLGKKQFEMARKANLKWAELLGDTITSKFYREFDHHLATKKSIDYLLSFKIDVEYPLETAFAYATIKDSDNAFKYLNRTYERHLPQISLMNQPIFDFMRNDSRFLELYKKAGFKAYDEYRMRHQIVLLNSDR